MSFISNILQPGGQLIYIAENPYLAYTNAGIAWGDKFCKSLTNHDTIKPARKHYGTS
jgi:hypothetical protein